VNPGVWVQTSEDVLLFFCFLFFLFPFWNCCFPFHSRFRVFVLFVLFLLQKKQVGHSVVGLRSRNVHKARFFFFCVYRREIVVSDDRAAVKEGNKSVIHCYCYFLFCLFV